MALKKDVSVNVKNTFISLTYILTVKSMDKTRDSAQEIRHKVLHMITYIVNHPE